MLGLTINVEEAARGLEVLKRGTSNLGSLLNLERQFSARGDQLDRVRVLAQTLHAEEQVLSVVGHDTRSCTAGIGLLLLIIIENGNIVLHAVETTSLLRLCKPRVISNKTVIQDILQR